MCDGKINSSKFLFVERLKFGVVYGSVFFGVLTLLLFTFRVSYASEIEGKAVYIYDGDTFLMNSGMKIRLASIDSPEKGKNGKPDGFFSIEASEQLKKLIGGHAVKVHKIGSDRYGRIVAWVYDSNGNFINEEMVERGLSLFYKHKGNSASMERKLLNAQIRAVKNRVGFWKDILNLKQSNLPWICNKRSSRCFYLNSKISHKINEYNRVYFDDLEQAVKSGYSPARNIGFWPDK